MTTEVNSKASNERYHANKILAVVLVGYLLIVLDLSIIFTGLPEIGRTLEMDTVTLSWVHNAYLLCFGGFLLLAARAGDLLGRKRMMLWGISLFTLSSLVIGVSQTSAELIGARAIQGIGASIMAPSVLSIISSTFEDGQWPFLSKHSHLFRCFLPKSVAASRSRRSAGYAGFSVLCGNLVLSVEKFSTLFGSPSAQMGRIRVNKLPHMCA